MAVDWSKYDDIINSPVNARAGTELTPQLQLPESRLLRFGNRWFPATETLAKGIAEYWFPEMKEARARISELRAEGGKSAELADRLEAELGEKPTKAQTIAAAVETALYAAPIPAVKALKGSPILKSAITGGAMGSLFGTTSGIRAGENLPQILSRTTLYGMTGSVLGAGTSLILDQGVFKLLPKVTKIIPTPVKEFVGQARPILDVLNSDFGEAGKKIARLWKLTRSDAGVIAGQPTLQAMEAGLLPKKIKKYIPLTEEEAWLGENSVYDILQGKGIFEQATPQVQKAATTARDIFNSRASMAENKNILIGKKENYFTQIIPSPERVISTEKELTQLAQATSQAEREAILLSNDYKRPYLINAVNKLNAFPTVEEANNVLESWGKWILGGGKFTSETLPLTSWLLKTGQATTEKEAQVLLKTSFQEFIKPRLEPISGFLERHREINFPFFDPDPRRVLPAYILDTSSRLAYLQNFGKGGMATLLKEIEQTQGAPQMLKAEQYVRTILGTVKRDAFSSSQKALTTWLRGLNTPKLSFSAITNLGQNLNTLLGSDLKSLGYGLRVAFTEKGFKQAMENGAILQSVMHQVLGYAGGGTKFADAILKYSGFSWTEMFNRIVASNAGQYYLKEQANLLSRFPDNPIIRGRITELGIDVEDLISRGFNLTKDEILRAGNIFSAKTQFLNDAASLPLFASSPWGQVVFQFKNYAYNQTKFVFKELANQWQNKNYSGLVRDLTILSLVFPVVGEVSSDIRSTLTGSKRPKEFFTHYLSNIANAGTFGLAFDIWQSAEFGQTLELAMGPTAGMVAGFLENLVRSIKQRSPEDELRFILNQTGFGRIITGYVMPPKTRRKGYGNWWEFYENF